MSTFTLATSCLTTSNLPWFKDLTFQVPMQYCSLQHWTLLLSPATSTTGYCFCFGSIPSFFLELFLHWSPVAYWAPNWPGAFLFQYSIILPFYTVHGVLKARIWSGLPSPSPVAHILSDLPTVTRPSWVAPSGTRLWSWDQMGWFPVITVCLPSDSSSWQFKNQLVQEKWTCGPIYVSVFIYICS